MTAEQISVIKELLNDKDVKGKKQLKNFLWLNTSTPKFKVGDCFIISESDHKIYGYPVKDFMAKVTKIEAFGGVMYELEWQYTLEMEVECGDKKTTSNSYLSESKLARCQRCNGNLNILGEALSKHSDSVEVYL